MKDTKLKPKLLNKTLASPIADIDIEKISNRNEIYKKSVFVPVTHEWDRKCGKYSTRHTDRDKSLILGEGSVNSTTRRPPHTDPQPSTTTPTSGAAILTLDDAAWTGLASQGPASLHTPFIVSDLHWAAPTHTQRWPWAGGRLDSHAWSYADCRGVRRSSSRVKTNKTISTGCKLSAGLKVPQIEDICFELVSTPRGLYERDPVFLTQCSSDGSYNAQPKSAPIGKLTRQTHVYVPENVDF